MTERVLLGDVIKIIHGKNQRDVESESGAYPIYGSGGIMGCANDFLCPAHTVIVGRKGTINRPIYVDEPFWNVDTAFGLVADRDRLLPRYLFHFCSQFDFMKLNTAATIPSLTKKSIQGISFMLPDISVQRESCARLDFILGRIDDEQSMLESFDELVKSRFVEMFGDGSLFDQCMMEELLSGIVSGTNVSGTQRPLLDGEFAVLKISAVTKGWFKPDEYKVVDDVSSIRMVHPRKGDLLFSRANTSEMVGATAIVDNDYDQLFLPDKLWRLDPARGVDTVFLKHMLSSSQLRAEMSKVSTGTSGSMQNISMAKFRRLNAFLPPIALQQEFAVFVHQADKLKSEVGQAIEKLQMLYDSLAQEYFALD